MPPKRRLPGMRLGLIGLLSLGLAACAATKQSDPSLAHACQIKPCRCAPEATTLFNKGDRVPLKWKENGDAYCPEGYVLQLDSKEKQGGY